MRILVLAGGNSAERTVSLESGRNVANALRERGHDVTLSDPAEISVASLDASQWEIAIPVVHGTGGEDGTLQRDLAQAGLKWVGSSADASELTFDKIRTNRLLRQAGISVPDHVVVQRDEPEATILSRIETLGGSVVTKPPRQGSSIGVSIAHNRKQIQEGLALAFAYDDECLVETYIDGREVTVAVVEGRPLPSLQIRPVAWYDYESKYADDRTEYCFESETESCLRGKLAKSACDLCGVMGIARVDLRVDQNNRPFILEINTIPGMTSHSLVPMAARQDGLTLAELFESAIASALSL